MKFLRQFVRRCHQHLSSKQLLPTEELISHNNYETDYYSSQENHCEVLNNIKLRHMQNDFKQLFEPINQSNPQLIADEIIKNISLMPNKLDPIWYYFNQIIANCV